MAAGARAVTLTPDSPFLPTNGGGGGDAAAQANSPLELRGILALPDGYKFNVCDPTGHTNVWVGLKDSGQPIIVRACDVAHNTVTVEYQGRELTLSLPKSRITPMSMQSPMAMMPQPQMMMGQGQMPPPSGNIGVDQERQRLERIAEEIRRRRALRAGMQSQQRFPGPPGGFQPQP
jgi:hypothetical protein